MLENNFSGIYYDYDTEYTCENEEECMDCNCRRIVDIKIKSIDLIEITNKIYNSFLPQNDKSRNRFIKLNDILINGDIVDKYCIHRIITMCDIYLESNWKVKVVDGYYGEEIDNPMLDMPVFNIIKKEVSHLFKLSSITSKIKYVLELEYGFILDSIKTSDFELIEINKNQIEFEFNKNKYLKTLDEDLSFYSNYNLPRGVVRKIGSKYQIIDGYHRILSSKSDIFKVFKVK